MHSSPSSASWIASPELNSIGHRQRNSQVPMLLLRAPLMSLGAILLIFNDRSLNVRVNSRSGRPQLRSLPSFNSLFRSWIISISMVPTSRRRSHRSRRVMIHCTAWSISSCMTRVKRIVIPLAVFHVEQLTHPPSPLILATARHRSRRRNVFLFI